MQPDLARRACNLETMTFRRWGDFPAERLDFRELLKLEHLTLEDCFLQQVPPLPVCLRSLSITQRCSLNDLDTWHEQALLENDLPLLTEVSVSWYQHITRQYTPCQEWKS